MDNPLTFLSLLLFIGMSPGPEFAMEGKLNQPQKMNNKAEGTPKSESKSKVCFPGNKFYFDRL